MAGLDGYPSMEGQTMEAMVQRLMADLVQKCKVESGGTDLGAEAQVKDLVSLELLRRAAMAGGPVPGPGSRANGTGVECDNSGSRTLEQERVKVDGDFQFTWHRPPLEEVARQTADMDTIRIFLNGCFDLMHVGHFNVIRQAKATFYQKGYKHVTLVVGIHSDAAITNQKGPPLQCDEERIAVLQATKWVDEMATDLPYVSMSSAMADRLQVNYICHGDDLPVVKGGSGMYSNAFDTGRFQVLKRTEGISTTQILERLLRQHPSGMSPSEMLAEALGSTLATTQRLSQFAAPADPWRPRKLISEASRVVYVDGSFDLLHAGQVSVLVEAAKLGDCLLVGLHADETVRIHKGTRPVLTMLERAMGVLSMNMVDDVVLDAPFKVTRELLTTMNVSVMVAGKKVLPKEQEEGATASGTSKLRSASGTLNDRYGVARGMGIFTSVESKSNVTTADLQQRFLERRAQISSRNSTLLQKELSYIENKNFVPEA